jgi:hypothetical protein
MFLSVLKVVASQTLIDKMLDLGHKPDFGV